MIWCVPLCLQELSDIESNPLSYHLHRRESFDNSDSLHADGDDAAEEVDDVAGRVVFIAPGVGGVGDAAGFIGGGSITLLNPPYGCSS